jgi:cholesterol oxidase
VAAYRLAEGGLRVCVLERGKAYPPGSFARRPREMGTNYWDPSRGYHGLFDFWSFRGIEALVSSGLGGGSLIYANVLLRKDERWFVEESPSGSGYEPWPVSRADLDPHYDRVERMMNVVPFPLGAPGYPDTPKTRAMRDAAQGLGLEWGLPNLAVSFSPTPGSPAATGEPIPEGPYPNLHGRPRLTCRLCGECDIGCNDGSKNSLDHTYLSAARHHGAEIRTRCEVRQLAPRQGGGFAVSYVEHHPDREGQSTDTSKLPELTISADRLVLAAGTLGTTYLLLRNRGAFPHLGPALGSRFCGNGDLLTLLLHSRLDGDGGDRRIVDASRGPVITSFVRVPDRADPGGDGPGYYIEDAGYPMFIDWLAEGTQAPGTAKRLVRFALRRIWDRITKRPQSDLSGELALLHGASDLSSSALPLLGMGRDVPDGVMRLRRGYLDVDWTTATSRAYFARVKATMAAMAEELGAQFRQNPLSYLKRVITVHPLGGCPMGRHDHEGVVDSYGQAFHYPGLHIADGSVMPGPVGANPSLTIAAFADRMAESILDQPGTRHPGGLQS